MKKIQSILLCGALAVLVLFALCLSRVRSSRTVVSFAYLGQHESHGIIESVVALNNNTTTALHCMGALAISRGAQENKRRFDLILAAKSTAEIAVASPPGSSQARLRCILTGAVGQHAAWMRNVGGVLDRVGLHVARSNNCVGAPLTLRLGRAASVSLSGFLNYHSSTNCWVLND